MDCSPPVSSVHEIFQARILGWVAISYSRAIQWVLTGVVPYCYNSSFSHIKGQIQLVVNKQEISEIHGPRMSDYLRNMAKWSGGHLVFC